MYEGIHTTLVLFKHFCLTDETREVSQYETFTGCGADAKQLQRYALLDQGVVVLVIKNFLNTQEEWVTEFVLFSSKLLNCAKHVVHRDDG